MPWVESQGTRKFVQPGAQLLGGWTMSANQGGGGGQQTGGGGNTALQDIIRQMQAAQEKANLMNEQRYKQILGTFEGLGKAGRARIQQHTAPRQAEATQS